MVHYNTFRDQIAIVHPDYGYALWESDPGEQYPPVAVGDVGFIREGKFRRLFNALLPENHQSHQRFGVPNGHEPLQLNMPDHIDHATLNPNNICSPRVTSQSGDDYDYMDGPPPPPNSEKVSFSCERKKEGAALVLPVEARREDTICPDRFRTWMLGHIDSWFDFSQQNGLGIMMEDIVLLTGCHRTTSRSNIIFHASRTDSRVSLRVQSPHPGAVYWEVLNNHGAMLSHGPSGENLPQNQSLFIRGFRVKRFSWKLPWLIKGAAGPEPDPRRHPEMEVVPIVSVVERRDPLHVLLDYIGTHTPGCDMAIVHDDDLVPILGVGGVTSLESLQPNVVINYFKRSKLKIRVMCDSWATSTNNESPRASGNTKSIKVAMLSDRVHIFRHSDPEPLVARSTLSVLNLQSADVPPLPVSTSLIPALTSFPHNPPVMAQTPKAQTPTTAAASSHFQAIFDAAVKSYQKQTKDLIAHPLTSQLQSCDSTSAILAILQDQVREFDKSRSGDERLTECLSPTVNVLSPFSAAVSGIGLVFPPANVIFASIGIFVQTANDVSANKDILVELFERIGIFFTRLESYSEVAPTTAMTDLIMRIMVEVLGIFGIATMELRRRSAKRFLRKLAGMADLEDALKRLDKLTQEAQMAFTEVLRITHSIRDEVKVVDGRVERVGDIDQKVEGVQHDDVKVDLETVDDKLRRRSVDSKEQGPPSLVSLPILPPIDVSERRSFGVRELSPVQDAATKSTQPISSIERAALESTNGARASLPAPSLGSAAGPATAPPAGAGNRNSDGDVAIAHSTAWWNNLKRSRTNPIEEADGYARIRSRAIEAIGGALGMAASIGHEVLFTGVDLLQFSPVPGLDIAGKILLSIWDAVGLVEANRFASLRLIERCANILISIRGEIADAGYTVAEELGAPIEKLVKAFEEVHNCLNKLGKSPFLKRYLKRDEILSNICACDTSLNDARETFNASVQIRILRLVKANDLRQKEMLESLSHVSPPVRLPLPSAALPSFPVDTESVRDTLYAVRTEQNAQDRAHDMADLHQHMLTALSANDDNAMIEVLQIARSEMPDAIRTLERALEHVCKDDQVDAEESTTALPSQEEEGNNNGPSLEPGNTSPSNSSADRLDREFIVTGIDALRRLSKGTDLGLPSWTITQFEVELEEKVGFGSFSEVFRGTWRKNTVAVKVLDKTTPRKIFLREVKIWKSLHHPNVLELFGASSASGEPPWFLVCKYYPQGNLVKYLKGLSKADAARNDAVKMIYEISKGMAYLHEQGVLHGDLKAANILVDDDTSCVISDFGQSEMKSEVYRLTCASQPRGTLRWQAPELMEGAQILRPEMDAYAFGICCWEILNMGALPWPLMEDSTVRHLVLNKHMRPELPPSNLLGGRLTNVIRSSWDSDPLKRPSFAIIVREIMKQRAG